jgi:tubulin gamma
MHSVSGGTGSGLGSYILEQLADHFPKKFVQTYSIFPSQVQGEVIVHPYNTMLTLQRLITAADATVVFDNTALERIINARGYSNTGYKESNSLV